MCVYGGGGGGSSFATSTVNYYEIDYILCIADYKANKLYTVLLISFVVEGSLLCMNEFIDRTYETFVRRFGSVVAITLASHARGPGFEPQSNQTIFFCFLIV